MANPQLENGYTKITNDILDELILLGITGTEMQIVLCVIRKTYGFNKKEDMISISQFKAMTKKSNRTIIYALQQLESKNVLIIKRQTRDNIKQPNLIGFNKDYSQWVVQNIAPQVQNNREQAKDSSAKLRSSAKLCKKVVQNPVKNVQSFAHTKDTLTKENIQKKVSQHVEIINMLSLMKGIKFENKEEYKHYIRRNTKLASQLIKVYPKETLAKTMLYCADKFPDWKLEGVSKNIQEVKNMQNWSKIPIEQRINKLIEATNNFTL